MTWDELNALIAGNMTREEMEMDVTFQQVDGEIFGVKELRKVQENDDVISDVLDIGFHILISK